MGIIDEARRRMKEMFGGQRNGPRTEPAPTPTIPPPAPQPSSGPVTVKDWDWANFPGGDKGPTAIAFGAGETIAFKFTVPLHFNFRIGADGHFSTVPTGGYDYFDRDICISDTPGDFSTRLGSSAMGRGQDVGVYFTVGGYPQDKYGRGEDRRMANLNPGGTYYVNVRQSQTFNDFGQPNPKQPFQVNVHFRLPAQQPTG